MMRTIALMTLLTGLLSACGGESPPAMTAAGEPVVAQETTAVDCSAGDGIDYLCGISNGEDILQLGNSDWLLVSGMDGSLSGTDVNGRIHMVNAAQRSVEILFPGTNPLYRHDTALYGDCPGPLDARQFSAHGLALQKIDKGPAVYRLYMTSHGAREAIEVFEVDAFVKPTITWVGCIPMPASSWTNSVAILDDGGFVATQFYDPARDTIGDVLAGRVTGHVFEWHPGGEVSVMEGTEMAGPNGIAVTDDQRWIFVASFGTGEVMRFDRSSTPPARDVIPVGIMPDNLRWTGEGMLLAAGDNTEDYCGTASCEQGWGVVQIVPYSLVATRIAAAGEDAALQNPSVGYLVNDEIWVGTYSGDRLAILPRQ